MTSRIMAFAGGVALLIASSGVLAATAVIAVVHRHDFVGPDQFLKRDEVLRLVILLAGISVCASLLWFRSTVALLLLSVIVAVDLFTFGVDFNPAISPTDFYPTTPALRYLQAHAGGYRVLVNTGPDSGQTIFHTHLHVLGGKVMGALA